MFKITYLFQKYSAYTTHNAQHTTHIAQRTTHRKYFLKLQKATIRDCGLEQLFFDTKNAKLLTLPSPP